MRSLYDVHKTNTYMVDHVSICMSVRMFYSAERILMAFNKGVMPLEGNPKSYFLISCKR
jgi:hypothetical protein